MALTPSISNWLWALSRCCGLFQGCKETTWLMGMAHSKGRVRHAHHRGVGVLPCGSLGAPYGLDHQYWLASTRRRLSDCGALNSCSGLPCSSMRPWCRYTSLDDTSRAKRI